jgi:hypothetical protein
MTTHRIGLNGPAIARRLGVRLVVSGLALSLMTGALAGCGSAQNSDDGVASVAGSAKPTAASSDAPAADSQERALQFARCLRAQGLDVQDPGSDGRPKLGSGVDAGKLQAALDACRRYAPDFLSGAGMSAAEREQMLVYIKCLREQGIAIDDPDPATGMPQHKDFAKFRQPDEAMKKAQQACQDKQPNGLGH